MAVPACLADAEELLGLQRLAYRSEAAIYDDYTIAPLRQTLAELQTDFINQVILKEAIDGRIIGSIRGRVQEGTGYIGRLIVHPDFQNQGIGSRLVEEIENRMPGVNRFELFTGHLSERNLYLYKKLGYRAFRTEKINDRLTQIFLEKIIKSESGE